MTGWVGSAHHDPLWRSATMRSIYLDNNATTPLLPAAGEAMRPHLGEMFGNPASAHHAGRRARRALEDARECCAALLGSEPDEVVFTSGATEANNLALFGLAGELPASVIVSAVEHPSVTEPVQQLKRLGFGLDVLPVDGNGIASPAALPPLLCPDSRLMAVMRANHETGALQPVAELADLLDGRLASHCDAVQAAGRVPIQFRDLRVTTLSISAHKFHGPAGIGALFVRRGTSLHPRVWGGQQQQGRRPGTEPVALAVGMAVALDAACREMEARTAHVLRLRQLLLHRLNATSAPVILNGPENNGIPHTLNVSFPGCAADVLLIRLDLAGVACSTGSACSSGSLLPSPVLQAMEVPPDRLRSAMRFSLSPFLTEAEVEDAAGRIAACVRILRQCPDD